MIFYYKLFNLEFAYKIIFTSNIGTGESSKSENIGFNVDKDSDNKQKRLESRINSEIKKFFKPEFLNSTDWKILRHIRQKALNITTSLSDVEYLQLEQQRQAAAARII